MPKTPQPLEASAGLRPTAPWRGRRRLTSLPQVLAWLRTGRGTRRTRPQILHWTRPWTGPSLRTQSRTLQGPALSPGPGDRPQRGWASGGRSVPRGTRKASALSPKPSESAAAGPHHGGPPEVLLSWAPPGPGWNRAPGKPKLCALPSGEVGLPELLGVLWPRPSRPQRPASWPPPGQPARPQPPCGLLSECRCPRPHPHAPWHGPQG